ncbi:dihydrodipicolinate synthase family protein [Devosia sp. A449]
MTTFHGVVPPVVTPLTENYEVDYVSLTRVVENLVDGGVHGLFVLGSSGEVVFHDDATRRKIIEHTIKIANGRVPVLAGTIDPTTDRTIGHAKAAQELGVDAVVVTAPFYARTSQPEVADHFRYVRDAIDVPVIAYDIPVCVNIKLERKTTVTLAREGVIAGLKDSSGDDGNFRFCLLDLADLPDFFLMTGSEIVVDNALQMGAHGVVPGLANVDPHGYVRLWNHAKAGNWDAARKEQERLCRLFEMVWVALPRVSAGSAGVGSFKTAMQQLGIIETNIMARPQRRLDAAETSKIVELVRAAGLMG